MVEEVSLLSLFLDIAYYKNNLLAGKEFMRIPIYLITLY